MSKETKLCLLRGMPYEINHKISIRQPTLNEIFEMGEDKYYSIVFNFVATPSDMKSSLFDMGIDYESVSEFSLFCARCKVLNQKDTAIFFGDVDFSKLQIAKNPQNNEPILAYLDDNGEMDFGGVIIDSHIYELIASHIRHMNKITKNVEKPANEFTKKILIDEDRLQKKTKKKHESQLSQLILALVNCSDFPYNFKTIWELPISVLMDSVYQIQKYKNAQNLIQGIYSGSIDGTKLDKSDLKWI